VLSLINSLRLAAGRPTLGFVNPFLYRAASAFTGPTPSARTPPALSSLTSGLTLCRGASCACRVVSRVSCRVSRVAVVRRSTDIEECQKQDAGCCSTSFACEKGWDPYTGTPANPSLLPHFAFGSDFMTRRHRHHRHRHRQAWGRPTSRSSRRWPWTPASSTSRRPISPSTPLRKTRTSLALFWVPIFVLLCVSFLQHFLLNF